MPRVDWPKKQSSLFRSGLVLAVALIIISIAGELVSDLLINPPKASAATVNTLPDQSQQSNHMTFEIAESFTANVINSPHAYVKVYLDANDTGNAFVNIWNTPFNPCGNNATHPDWYTPSSPAPCAGVPTFPNRGVTYDFFAMDSNENPGALIQSVNGQSGGLLTGGTVPAPGIPIGWGANGGWSGNVPLPVSKTVISNITGYRVVLMEARFDTVLAKGDCGNNACQNRLHSFTVRTVSNNDQLGYWAAGPGSPPPDQMYNIHYVGWGDCNTFASSYCNFDTDHTTVNFAPNCLMNADTSQTIRWFDADSIPAGFNLPYYNNKAGPVLNFYQYDANGVLKNTQTVTPTSANPYVFDKAGNNAGDVGGNNEYRELRFVAHPGWKYSMVWHYLTAPFGKPVDAFGAANNIQLWLPFDSINYQSSCWNYHTKIQPVGHANGDTIDVTNPANQNLTFNLSANNIGQADGPANASLNPKATIGGAPAGAAAARQAGSWSAALPVIPGGGTVPGGQVTWKIDPTFLPVGTTTMCFGDTISPHTSDDPGPYANDPPDICYNLLNSSKRFPSAQGTSSDIHADNGACLGAPAGGGVSGNSSANSYGQYVVSSAGFINNFASNSGLGSGRDLSLGNLGGYNKICQKDFYTFAANNMPAGATWTTSPGGVQNVNNLPGQVALPNGKYVAYILGDIHIQGTLTHSTTLIASGKVWIDGDISDAGGTSRTDAPALAIISQGDVSVTYDSASPKVSAFIVSDGTIDTCYTSGGGIPSGAHCQNVLHLIGFMLGKTLKLNRLGNAGGIGSVPGEIVSMNPVLYLNPPQFLDASIDTDAALQGQGERAPLY